MLVMMREIGLWGDSIGKGVVYDEQKGRYVILRENCVNLLSKKLNCPIANHAVMGATAAQGMERMREDFLHEGGLAVIEFGGNDCDMPWKEISEAPEKEYRPKATIEEFMKSLEMLVSRVRGAGMEAMLVASPPLDAEKYFGWVSRGLNAQAILSFLGDVQHIARWQAGYAEAVRKVAARTGSRLLDLSGAFLGAERIGDCYCLDGIHPNAQGHQLLAQEAERRLGLAL